SRCPTSSRKPAPPWAPEGLLLFCSSRGWERAEQLAFYGATRAGMPRLVGAGALVVGEAHGPGRDRIDRRQETDVKVRHPGVPGVATAADDVAAAHVRAGRERDRVRREVAELGVLAGRVLDDDVVARIAPLAV